MVSEAQEALLQGFGIAASAVYFTVAFVLSRRRVDDESRRAHRAFIVWWAGLGLLGVTGAFLTLATPLGSFGLLGARLVLYGLVGLIFVMLSGLLYYLLYVYTGKHAYLMRVALFYVALMVLFVYLTESQQPYIDASGAEPELAYADERPPGDPLSVLLSVGLILPPLAAAAAYLGLYWRVPERTSRYRILMVSGGLVLWLGFSLVNTLTQNLLGVEESPFLARLAGQALGVLAALMVLAAYLPPGFVRRRFQVRSILEEQAPRDETRRQARPSVLRLATKHST